MVLNSNEKRIERVRKIDREKQKEHAYIFSNIYDSLIAKKIIYAR